MNPQSSAYQLLVHSYRLLLQRMRASRRAAQRESVVGRQGRLLIETLQPRLMMSATASGSESLVNTTITGSNYAPTIAMDRAGASVIVWTSPGSTTTIDGRQFNASSAAVGSAFQVNVSGVGASPHPTVAMDDAGGFVVCWDSGSSVYVRLYDSAGAALTGETQVATDKVGLSASCVAMTQGGAFTVVWEGDGTQDSDGIYARQFTASGLASGAAFLVNTTTAGVQTNPAVAADVNGNYCVAWTDESSGSKVEAVYLPASGTASSQIEVGGSGTDTEDQASVGFDGSGNFIVTWAESSPSFGIYSRRYQPDGTPIDASPVLVSSYNGAAQVAPAVAERLDGSYLISWTDTGGHDGSGNGVFAQAYTAAGAADGGEFGVNTTTSGNQQDAGAAWAGATADIVWDGNGVGDSAGIFVQRYATSLPADQAPVNTVPATQSITENNPLAFSSANGNAISVSDADAYGGTEQVTLTASSGTLSISSTSGITFVSGGTGDSSMSFTGTIANLDAALGTLVFMPAKNSVATATLQIVTDDLGNTGSGGPLSTTSSVAIHVSAPANPANNVIPGAQTTTLNTPLVFMPANGNTISVGSSWDDVELTATHGTLTLSTTSGLSFSSGTGTGDTTMEFSGSQSAMDDALNGLIYTPTTGYTGSAQVQVTTIVPPLLGLLFGSSQTTNIAVTVTPAPAAANQAPAASVPAVQSANENVTVAFSSSSSNAISVADADGNTEQVTLVATSGTVTLHGTGGLTFTSGTGANDSSEVFSGTLANINAALNGMSFLPALDFVGSGGIYVSFNDLGSGGTGSALTSSATVAVTMLDVPPAVAQPAAASPDPVNGTSTALSVLGASDNGESNLTYTWATTGTPPAPVTFSVNGTNSAQNTTATFADAGTYNFQVTITDSGGLTATSSVSVQVNLEATTVVVSPASPIVGLNGTEQFSAVVDDQFGNALASQPSISWSLAAGSGSISAAGLYTAPGSASTATVAAAAADLTGSASVTVVAAQQTLVVDTDDDDVNGNTSSDSALLADPGADGISLREAILAANNTPGTTLILFNIGGGGPQTIDVTSALPTIAEPVIIDGTSQPGFAGAPLIELNGGLAGATANGLTITVGNCTVRDLVIDGFGGSGVELSTNGNNLIEGNYIGTNATGTSSDPNAAWGIDVASGSSNTIGGAVAGTGNVISGNTQGGIRVTGGSFLVCEDNSVVRVDAQTGAILANYATGLANDGVALGADGSFYVPDYSNNVIYHYDAAGNLLSTFGTGHLGSPQDLIVGPNGDLYAGNVGDGIQEFSPSGTFLSTFVANGSGGLDNVKGMVFGPNGNLYVANLTDSDVLQFNGTTGALVSTFVSDGSGGLFEPEDLVFGPDGNLYVTDYANDTVDRYNGSTGASLGTFISGIPANPYGLRFDASGNIDVSSRSSGEIRTYNGQTGAFLHNLVTGLTNPAYFTATPAPSQGDTIQGNYIGTAENGATALGNGGDGIRLDSLASGNSIGGQGAGQGNTIAFNTGDGIDAGGAGQVTISRNSIYENDKLGIDLTSDVATSNSGTLNSADPNDGMNYPVLSSADVTGGQLTVAGYIGSAPNQSAFADATVELFQDNASAGSASGETYLGSLTSNAEGNFTGTITAGPLAAGNSITATATSPSGDTSQFAAGQAVDFAPTVSTPASASPNPVTGTTTAMSVLGASDGGESHLTYTWATTGIPPAPVAFSSNGNHGAKNTTATFTKAGNYNFQVTITDADGLTTTSSVSVTVSPTLASVAVAPATASLVENATQQFSATGYDQFGTVLAAQPAFTWSSTGVGSVSASGLYTAPGSGSSGTATVTATSGSVSGGASVSVTDTPPTVATTASATPNPVTGTTTSLSVLGASDGGESNLTYSWATTGTPPAPITFSDNGDNSANNTTATFTQNGTYDFTVTITDASGLSTTSSVSVVVSQKMSEIIVTPSLVSVPEGTTQQCTAVAYDQFGNALATQPVFTWSVTGGGSISRSGLWRAPATAGSTPTISATSGSYVGLTELLTVASPADVVPPGADPGTGAGITVQGYSSSYVYNWSVITKPAGATEPTFSTNASTSAVSTSVTVYQAGSYLLACNFGNANGSGTRYCITVALTVEQTTTVINVTPGSAALNENGTQQFSATATDQFGNAMSPEPTFAWSLAAGTGSVNQSGLYTAGGSPGTATVQASSGSVTASAPVTVTDTPPTVAAPASASPSPVTGTTTRLSVLGASDGGESTLTYTWSTTGTPPAPVTFSDNGDNSAKNTTATFAKAGTYNFRVTITDANGLTTASSVAVTVSQTLTSIVVTPSTAALDENATRQFSATAYDQFGAALTTQPTLAWSVASGSGSVNASGLYIAPASATSALVTATSGGVSGSASISVVSVPTLVVDSTSDVVDGNTSSDSALQSDPGADGKISLREAILAADNTPGPTQINFDIPGGGTQTIVPASALPAITKPVIIDGASQPGYSGTPLVQISGTSAGSSANGLELSGGDSTVEDLAVNQFSGGDGILIQSAGGDTIAGNEIGTNAAGTSADANNWGVWVLGVGGNIIGGTTGASRNVISGNTEAGVCIYGAGANNNLVEGNYVGLNAAGIAAVGNLDGIDVTNGATNNTIGGTTVGSGNVISGNDAGVFVDGATTTGTDIQGNYIGTNAAGTAAVPNTIAIAISAANNVIGATAAGTGNVISGNTDEGVFLNGASATGNVVQGNYIGTNAAGNAALANGNGLFIANGAADNTIGGTDAGSGNVISGNIDEGVFLNSSGTTGNVVRGNFVGVDVTGTVAVPNGNGILIANGAADNTLGGTDAGSGNVISGNSADGIEITGAGANGNLIEGDYIGTNATGAAALGNAGIGVLIETAGNTIGGGAAGAGNVISGNGDAGVRLNGSSATGNLVQGNYIGTTATGMAALSNGSWGLVIDNDATGTTVESNVVSGNTTISAGSAGVGGIYLAASDASISGNLIGLGKDGSTMLPNGNSGASFSAGIFADNSTSGASIVDNSIAYNAGPGVAVAGGADGVDLSQGSYFDNTGLGIDLNDDGVTANTGSKNTSLANDGMNFPVFTSASLSGTTVTVAGYVGSAANETAFADARVEIFQADENSSRYGQGQTYLGYLTTDANGNFSGSLNAGGLVRGDYLTATATDTSGDTSEFGPNYETSTPPTVATDASATPNPVTGKTTGLSVLGADDGGEPNLTYTWATTGTPPAPVTFSENGDNSAKNTVATFTKAGAYNFQVTITNAAGLTATSSVSVTVSQTLTAITVTPSGPSVAIGESQTFAATALDQFGSTMATQPAFSWSATGGDINAMGLFTAPAAAGDYSVGAASGSVQGTATVAVTNGTSILASPNPDPGTRSSLSVAGSAGAGLTYTWSAASVPTGAASPTFSNNGSADASATVATFNSAGSYALQVQISDGTVSSVDATTVTVVQTLTSISVAPSADIVDAGDQQQFSAIGYDQFGQPMSQQPPITWSVSSGAGSIDSSGLYTAPDSTGGATITAADGSIVGQATVSIEAPAGITVSPTSALTTTDDGGTADFTIALTRPPTAAVTIGLQSSNPAAGMPTVDSVTFTPVDWDVAQEVTVAGFDDTAVPSSQIEYQVLTLPAQSADPLYAGLVAPDVNLTDIKEPPVVQTSAGITQYLAGSPAVVVDGGLTLQGPAVPVSGATVTFASGYASGQDSLLFAPQGTITGTWDQATGTLTLSGTASVADYQAALQSVAYINSNSAALTGGRTIEFSVTNDGGTASATRSLQVAAPNAPPSIVAPASAQTTSDAPLVFSQATQSVVAIVDPDAGDSVILVSLTARKGSLTLPNTQGLTFAIGNSSGSLAVQFSGTLPDVNAALDGLQFIPFSGYTGSASLLINVNDLGNSGDGIPKSATTTVPITVQAPAPPVVPAPAAPPTFTAPVPAPVAFGPVVIGPVTIVPVTPVVEPPAPTYVLSGGGSSTSSTGSTGTGSTGSDSGTPGPANAAAPANPVTPARPAPGPAASPKEQAPSAVQRANQGPAHGQTATPARSHDTAAGPGLAAGSGGYDSPAVTAGAAVGDVVVPADDKAALSNANPMFEKLDKVTENLVDEHHSAIVAGTASFISVGASVVYLAWILRAGSLASSLLSSMPAWSFVDPLPILDQMSGPEGDEDDDETLQSMVGET